ncbi:enoyl-CoA hydratase [Lutimaribacter sp. EGI FJ00015]|uniref:Enoyl-CoA hydratase n=1 Tax=Lutimaribacter degradans TaxID=2945989 RepID=A0ACC5ZXD6_9RHOB|nr:enoyl-CoA hydratase [Lutimaribacter sp. EGI FJ00013]MCM2562967.1 enoyl-CoA hydratase [Lutimaribacter sp. EGI FJ00013]MCO0614135.1 enoyl-CoA hydratase [Lutimaribacter sp. EGI FJ00015]MCO0636112.1 enoyl-CoA hydratase [Lutimaribacter sp. EGI FJ00014]
MDRQLRDTEEHAQGKLRLSRAGGVARIVLNAPDKLNAMSLSMWHALGDVCLALARDQNLRVVTIEGAGDRAFVVGADISEFGETRNSAEAAASYGAAVSRAEEAITALPVPTIALIRGYCIGGGLEIAMRCDLRLARDDARFAITPAKLGLGYGYDGIALLERRVGHATTADLLFSGRKMAADEAMAKGICDHVYQTARYDEATHAYIKTMAENAPLSIRAIKAALIDLARPETARNPDHPRKLAQACFDSADYREGQAAFSEKRPPRFEGR